MPRALVTGGAGFIGSALVRALVARGYDVRVYDDLSVGDPANLEGTGAELVRGDVRDLDALIGAARRVRHGLSPGGGRGRRAVDRGAARQLRPERARHAWSRSRPRARADVGRFVFSSSNAPLGDGAYPAREDKPVAPLSPYGASKAVGEAYCSAFHGAYGMHAVTVRFSNAFGPRSAHKGNVIPLFIRRLRAGEELVVYGDGEQTRDFVFCEDLADGLVRAAEADGAGGEIFQLASGLETSLNRLLELLTEVSGIEPRIRREPPRAGEILRNYSAIDKARERLGYEPSVTLAEGLARTWAWFDNA